jgi:DNA-binding MarR family transcriptional regulator
MNESGGRLLSLELIGALHAVEARFEAALDRHGLSLAKFRVLDHLVTGGEPLALRTLARYAACVRSNITQLVDRLEAEKLVVRVDDPKDRRSILAELTDEGRRRHAVGARALKAAEGELFRELPRSQVKTVVRRLGSLKCPS